MFSLTGFSHTTLLSLHHSRSCAPEIVLGVEEVQLDSAEADDDANVPLSVVIQDALGLDIDNPADVDTISHCVESTEKGPDDTLVAAGEEEDIWAYINFDSD